MKCNFSNCVEKLNLLSSLCPYCNLKYCLKHRLPESHSEECTESAKTASQKQYKKETGQLRDLQKRKGVSVVSMSEVQKDHDDARKRLSESIKKKQSERSSSSSSSTKKTRK